MRLLLLGSLFVLLSVAAWGTVQWLIMFAPLRPSPPAPPVFSFVSVGRDANAAHTDAVVWQTSTGREDCADVVDRRRRDERRQLAALISSANDAATSGVEEGACAPFQLGEVEPGVKVEVVGECGRMARIRILAGRLEGRQGCIEPDQLSAEKFGAGSIS